MEKNDYYYMRCALEEAQKAYQKEEVPIGAVIIKDDEIIARSHNLKEELNDPTAHAEVLAIKDAAQRLGGWRLNNCTLYVTIEPCPMCAGALVQARVDRVVYGASDSKAGAAGSVVNLFNLDELNHQIEVEVGVLEEECSNIMKRFFKELRN
ncbi:MULTISPECIES: tRNA adenosine(34) deaminase TadA [unclassified Candidatus Frackibacter]|uniref:tRNA adenosine(34) deaminase TadA n=1 Tax=unclassified Candidatus Frackibacter TaxID=2648818 RepID=UPI00079486FA|nr:MULTISPECIES: tRNA adenosine(34) deaminase TadA [unclassified Candidatus Frackibacter]KXS45811.1 MAG: tRNA-adenosine deaminase [Candidatus Frackibacter sp. T328-2]SDC53956.1 tRNA-adenosine deaminase [Candidatus Frackibacter sp. WG11]SEM66219.1 tRNA-adenosine deaminase [Candidatus Frackibacter sp. WG12]SFL77568.1 tRNA-adenosine deaminase [Candidatus Frackibacter sp. WG13]